MSALTIVLSAVMMTVIDFDRPRSGLIRVSQEALQTSVESM
ncbi:MAG: hypothetical protein ACI8XO_003857 [Verrucomicrobiales bacterium]|jgi:hypothetical protein